ncbi:hypothetical protein ACFMPD_13305 [Sedimentitalea sp. HM32M-2]|uniref:hypothetical protein n=1 Tax=Sedimentitalea sp. HM32M-2 TaxID=3351566 RepID=UPI00363B409B
MTILLRSLRFFGVMFILLSAILLIARLGIGLWADEFANTMAPPFALQAIDIVLLITSLSFTVFIVVLLYWLLVLAVTWALRSLLNAPSVRGTQPLNRLFGLVATAFFFGSLLKDLYAVTASLIIGLFSDVPGDIMASFRNGMLCIENNTALRNSVIDSSCVAGFFSDAAATIRMVAIGVFGDSGLGRLDPVTMVAAVAVFVIVAIVSSRVRSDLQAKEQFWLAYGAVAFFAIYLTLSAILAVPLLSEDTTEPPRPAEDLKTTLATMLPSRPGQASPYPGSEKSLSALFAEEAVLPPDQNGQARQMAPSSAEWLLYMRRVTVDIEANLNSVRLSQTQLRANAAQTARNQLDAAAIAYESEIDVRRGKREANRHFLDLRNWYQFVVTDVYGTISRCDIAVEAAERRYADAVDILGSVMRDGVDGTPDGVDRMLERADRSLAEEERAIRDLLRQADSQCNSSAAISYSPPSRRDYGSYLGVVGLAASWLLRTESMEVTLITGLIGFGLLGALVAQFVKSGGREEFDMARIATVVFSGFCAAIVVYVGAYGGLAIASQSGNDPNPYVVFGACLVGAVYSAEIWERAKKWFITQD